jgi:enterochelin esterase family protein
MKRHAIYFALALAGAAFTLQAAPLPAMPDPPAGEPLYYPG